MKINAPRNLMTFHCSVKIKDDTLPMCTKELHNQPAIFQVCWALGFGSETILTHIFQSWSFFFHGQQNPRLMDKIWLLFWCYLLCICTSYTGKSLCGLTTDAILTDRQHFISLLCVGKECWSCQHALCNHVWHEDVLWFYAPFTSL